MEIKNAIEILKIHNLWRRGELKEQTQSTKKIGESIDTVVDYFERSQSFEKLTDINIQLEMDRNWFKNKSEKLDSELSIYIDDNRRIRKEFHRIQNVRTFDKVFAIIGIVSVAYIISFGIYKLLNF